MIATDPSPPTRARLLDAAFAAGLLSEDQYVRAEANLSPTLRGPDTARALVAAGFLTQFQADRLLAGKTDGFMLGQYVILDQVGSGVTSRLYKARHKTMHRLVAIKVLGAQRTSNPARRAAFQADARTAAKLAHPNVVTVLDVNQLGERVYLVMEYIEGTNLAAFVRLRGSFTVTRACEFIRQAALGLQHAHDHNLMHGQLDPAALLVGHPGGVRSEKPLLKVSGFEHGANADPELASNDADPDDYRAPELSQPAATPTVESDLYSLGCVFYFLLTGTSPFRGQTREEKASQHLSATPISLGLLRPDVPPAIVELIGSLLSKRPTDRPLSAAEVVERLDPFADTDETLSRVDFHLTPGVGSTAAASGFLSGMHVVPPARSLELDDTSPWAGLAHNTIDEATEVTSDVRRPHEAPPKDRSLGLVLLVVAVSMLGLTLFGAAFAVRFLVGR